MQVIEMPRSGFTVEEAIARAKEIGFEHIAIVGEANGKVHTLNSRMSVARYVCLMEMGKIITLDEELK